jgi:hypothetical protein
MVSWMVKTEKNVFHTNDLFYFNHKIPVIKNIQIKGHELPFPAVSSNCIAEIELTNCRYNPQSINPYVSARVPLLE